jgi:hypothetical protein
VKILELQSKSNASGAFLTGPWKKSIAAIALMIFLQLPIAAYPVPGDALAARIVREAVFQCDMVGYPSGDGVVVLTNGGGGRLALRLDCPHRCANVPEAGFSDG